MKELLGEEGLKLYKKALQEEVNSRAFRDAVFNKSTKYFDGAPLIEPPSIIIAGPSACGKSYATDLFLKEVKNFPKKDEDTNGIFFACVDNAIGREVSQMRKLVIRAANKLGYTGVKDIDDHGSALKDVKDIIKQTAKSEEKFGLLIPETFANPLKVSGAMNDIYNLGRPVIFGSIEGHDEKNFKKVVAHMGNTRAWKTEGFDNVELDLNSTKDLCESKAYGPGGFYFGLTGSKKAKTIYEEKQKELGKAILTVVSTNDLVLKRYNSDTRKWENAESGEEGVKKVSNKCFKDFKAFKKSCPDSKVDLIPFSQTIRSTLVRSDNFEEVITQAHQIGSAVKPEPAKLKQSSEVHIIASDVNPAISPAEQSSELPQSPAKRSSVGQSSKKGHHGFFQVGPVVKQKGEYELENEPEISPLLRKGCRTPSE